MKYCWVNQSHTFKTETTLGFVWAPQLSRNDRAHPAAKFLSELSIGDILFSNHLGRISAIGRVDGPPQPALRPLEKDDLRQGWLVPVKFIELSNRIRPKDHFAQLVPFIGEKHSPMSKNGHIMQIYLAFISEEFARVLIEHIGVEYHDIIDTLENQPPRDWKTRFNPSPLTQPTRINVSSASGIFPYLPKKGKFHILTGENGTGKTRYLQKLSDDILYGLGIGTSSHSNMICFAGTIYDKFPKPQNIGPNQAYFYFGNKTNNNMFSEISPFKQLPFHIFSAKSNYPERSELACHILDSIGLSSNIELQLASDNEIKANGRALHYPLRLNFPLAGPNSYREIPKGFALENIMFKKDSADVSLENLSSGERMYILVVLGLCFCLQDHSLVLFDEPENSLHPIWQAKIIKDIHHITTALSKESTVVIATHAPLVVSSVPNVNSLVRDLPSTEDWIKFGLHGKNSDSVLESQFGLFSPRSLIVTSAIQECLQALVMSEFDPEKFRKSADALASFNIDFDITDPLFSAVKEIFRIRRGI